MTNQAKHSSYPLRYHPRNLRVVPVEYQILYQILNEISESLNFDIIQSNSKDLKELKDARNNPLYPLYHLNPLFLLLYCYPFSALSSAPIKHCSPVFGLHAAHESMFP